jgi:parvulin-like peptidyl-prolyl isomerase
MNHLRLLFAVAVTSFLGVFCSRLVCRSIAFRDTAGRVFDRGNLVAITNGRGSYQKDFDDDEMFAPDLIVEENLRRVASTEEIDPVRVDREISLLRTQFGDEDSFLLGIRSSRLSILSLSVQIADQLRSLQWLEKKINTRTSATEGECRDFYETHRGYFTEPVRFRASHIFLAAPADAPPEIVESKRKLIDALAVRLARGEPFPVLAAEASEDERTKLSGGDLGFFSAARMPPEFFAEVEKLTVGHASNPFRSHLGFHIVEVTETRSARVFSFDEAREDTLLALGNERRALIAKHLAEMLSSAANAGSD